MKVSEWIDQEIKKTKHKSLGISLNVDVYAKLKKEDPDNILETGGMTFYKELPLNIDPMSNGWIGLYYFENGYNEPGRYFPISVAGGLGQCEEK